MLIVQSSSGWSSQYHIGSNAKLGCDPKTVTLVQADCDELDHIFKEIKGIPKSSKRVQVWRGDFAVFIAENLPMISSYEYEEEKEEEDKGYEVYTFNKFKWMCTHKMYTDDDGVGHWSNGYNSPKLGEVYPSEVVKTKKPKAEYVVWIGK